MRGRYRRKSRQQAQIEQRFKQDVFDGALNKDSPASKIKSNELAGLENLVAYPDYLEGRSGSQKYSDTAMPGSGNYLGYSQHPRSGRHLLFRGAKAYSSDVSMASWAEIKPRGEIATAVTFNGDASVQLSGGVLYLHLEEVGGFTTLYWTLTNSGSTRTVSLYYASTPQDTTTLVAQGSRVGDGLLILTQKYPSSQGKWSLIGGYVTVAYTGDDTGASNTITGLYPSEDLTTNALITKSVPYSNPLIDDGVNSNFVCFRDSSVIYVDPYYNLYAVLNRSASSGGRPPIALVSSGSQSDSTPYGRRYLCTFSTIQQANGGILGLIGSATYPNRTTSAFTLLFEGPSNDGGTSVDYGEYWTALAVGPADATHAAITLDLLRGTAPLVPIGYSSAPHYTHVSIYGTLDIGKNGVDAVTGAGNNREIYVWIADVDYTATSYTDTTTDAVLRSRYAAGFGLRTRFWDALPGSYVEDGKSSGLTGDIAEGFLFAAGRGGSGVSYGQLAKPEYMGFYSPAFQFLKAGSSIMELKTCGNALVIICEDKTLVSYLKISKNVGSIESIFIVESLSVVSETIGVTDHGSIASIDTNRFIAHCSDHSIRIFGGGNWSSDNIGINVKNTLIKKIPSTTFLSATGYTGSTGVFFEDVYLLWYQTAGPDQATSATAYNSQCLRFAFGGNAGYGVAQITGSSWVNTPPLVGAIVIKDSKKVRRILAIDYTGAAFYWVETFDGYSNSGLTKYFKDKVAVAGTGGTDITCKIRFRELTGEEESHKVYHEETHIYLRPSGSAFISGFTVDLLGYSDGATTATEEVTDVPQSGDIQFWSRLTGRRIQVEAEFNASGFKIVSADTHYKSFDTATIGAGPVDTDEATYQAEFGSYLKIWLTRPLNLLNRASGGNFTLSGATPTAPTNVTGPDGKSYGLSFTTGEYFLSDTTNYGINWSISIWVKSVTLAKEVFRVDDESANLFNFKFNSNTEISIFGDTLPVTTIASGWHHFVFVGEDEEEGNDRINVYQNGVSLGTVTPAAALIAGLTSYVNPDNAAMLVYDLRMMTGTRTAAAIAHYYNDVVNNTGTKYLPLI